MTCEEFRDQVGAWALGALDEAEAAACEQHLREPGPHSGCTEALAQAREATLALSNTLPPEKPSPAVWDAIERRIGGAAPKRERSPWRERAAWGLALAAGVAAIFLGWTLAQEREAWRTERLSLGESRRAAQAAADRAQGAAKQADADRVACLKQVASLKEGSLLQRDAVALLEDPTTKIVPLAAPDGKGARASALVNLASRRAIVVSAGLPSRADRDLELWIIRGKEPPKPAGFMRIGADGVAAGEIDRALLAEAPDAVAVSLEPMGGRPTPTEVILVGAVKS